MPESKKTSVTAEVIAEFLKQTGFVFEMRMNEAFSKQGYKCEISPSFYDLEGDTERELDLIASKAFNEINVHFVIECKQSLLDKWIFICTKRGSARYYYAVKHRPSVDIKILEEKKLFSHLHIFDRKIPLAHNYISYSAVTHKKTDHLQIDECVYKLPKATAAIASRVAPGRHLFYPVVLFSGQLFIVNYKGSLVVEERAFVQYYTKFKSDAYKDVGFDLLNESRADVLFDFEESRRRSSNANIKRAARELAPPYQIDFVTESGLADYLAMVEKGVAAVQTDDWPLPAPPAKPTTSQSQ